MKKEIECEIVEDLFSGYVDGTLNVNTKELVEKHLLECNDCKNKLDEYKTSIKENECKDKKFIDFLKKARKKERIKTMKIIVIVIVLIAIIFYLHNFIILNKIFYKSNKALQSENMYIQEMQYGLGNNLIVNKKYFKGEKYKIINESYSDNGTIVNSIMYGNIETNEITIIDEVNKKITIKKGEGTESFNSIKYIPFINDDRFVNRVVLPIFSSIRTETFEIGSFSNQGRKCYVLNYNFETDKTWEIWIDRETGLPLKEININASKSYYSSETYNVTSDVTNEEMKENFDEILEQQNDILKDVGDSIYEYKYEFNIVKDEDVNMPDITNYNNYEIIQNNF